MIVLGSVTFVSSLISVLDVRMARNVVAGPRSVNVTAYRITCLLLHSPEPKRNDSNDILHGKYPSGYIRSCWLGNGR